MLPDVEQKTQMVDVEQQNSHVEDVIDDKAMKAPNENSGVSCLESILHAALKLTCVGPATSVR